MWPDDAAFRTSLLNDFHEETGDKRQEIVFIGQFEKGDRENITALLNECLLTDEEMVHYRNADVERFEDPFFNWDFYEMDDDEDHAH